MKKYHNKKNDLAVAVGLLVVALCACSQNKNEIKELEQQKQQENVGASMEISLVEIEDFETLCRWSNTIVKAKYVGTSEKFNSSTDIFLFELEEDFTQNVEEDILHVYESSDSSFIKGKSYYLFMTAMNSCLYPHIVYRRIETEFLLGEIKAKGKTQYTFYHENDLGLGDNPDVVAQIEEVVEKEGYVIEEKETFQEACEKADAIYRICVVEVEADEKDNPFVATCSYVITETIRERYENKSNIFTENLSEEVKEAAGIGVSSYPTTLAPMDSKIGEEFFLLERFDENLQRYTMYSTEHFLYRVDSEEGNYIRSITK